MADEALQRSDDALKEYYDDGILKVFVETRCWSVTDDFFGGQNQHWTINQHGMIMNIWVNRNEVIIHENWLQHY